LEGEAESEALSTESAENDPDLGEVIAAWPTLCDVVRREVLALVRRAVE
jgi:hypothetical protein